METKVIHITHELPVETLNDLAETAELGIGYWALWQGDNQWSQFDESNGKPFGDEFTLCADLMVEGIEVCSRVRPDIWHRIATDVIDGGADIDACDTIVQFGVFGELVYG